MSRWREYVNDLLNCPAIAREEALASVDQYPVQEDMANPPTLEEILKGKQRQRFGDMGLIELRKTNNFQPQSHF